MSIPVTVRRKPKQFGTLHPSGLNRQQRRTEAAITRGKPQADRAERAEDHAELQKKQRAAAVKRKHDAAHARALARKEIAGEKPSIFTRAKLRIQRSVALSQEKRKRRHETYQRKHQVV